MEVVIDIIVDGTITGVKYFSGEIVAGILFMILFFLFPSLRKFFSRKKYDTEAENQKNMEILRQDISQLKEILKHMEESKDKTAASSKQTHNKDEDRVKAELQRKQEELKQAEKSERTKNTDEILLPFETIRQPQKNQSQHKPESPTSQSKAPLRVQQKPRKKSHSFLKFFALLVLTVSAFMLVKSFLFSKPTDAEGQYELGYKYFSDKNYAEALKWYTLSAEQGLAQAQLNLGVMYSNGYGVSRDYAEAVNLYRKAADQSYAPAQFNLGVMYSSGYGVSRDYAEAVNLWLKAAEQGLVQAQYNLGVMYEKGLGVPKNISEARRWYQESSAQGYSKAKQALERMK